MDEKTNALAKKRLLLEELAFKKKTLLLEQQQEVQKLNRAKYDFAQIKRSYIKEYRQSTIQQMGSIDHKMMIKNMLL